MNDIISALKAMKPSKDRRFSSGQKEDVNDMYANIVINSARAVQDFCRSQKECTESCPFFTEDGCKFREKLPDEWNM